MGGGDTWHARKETNSHQHTLIDPVTNQFTPHETTKHQTTGYTDLDEVPKRGKAVARGKGRIIPRPTSAAKAPNAPPATARVAILSVGTRLLDAVNAANEIEASMPGVAVTVADARFVKPLDTALIAQLARDSDVLLTVEENSIGGFGSQVQQFLLDEGLLDSGLLRLRSMILPDRFIEAGPQSDQYDQAGLAARHMVEKAGALVQQVRERQQQLQQAAASSSQRAPAGVGVAGARSGAAASSFQVLP